MKVCFIMPKALGLFFPEYDTQFGGAEVQMYLLSKKISESDTFKTSFIVGDYGQGILVDGKVKLYPSFKSSDSTLIKINKFFNSFRKVNADVYLQMTLTPFSWIMALYCKIIGKKFIYLTAHDGDIDGSILGNTNKLAKRLSLLVFRFSNLTIVQNNYQFTHLNIKENKKVKLYSSLEDVEIIKGQKKYHLWLARAEKWKNPELFMQLAKEFPDENFMMVCPPVFEQKDDYYTELSSIAHEVENLEFINKYVPFNSINDVFSQAKTFINTSDIEGFPTTFLHATQHKIPIISYKVNPDEFLTTHEFGLVSDGNFENMKDNFKKIISEPDFYTKLSYNAGVYFNQNHSVSSNVKRLGDLISGIHS